MTAPHQITAILGELHDGRQGAAAELMPLIYAHLRQTAARHFSNERPHHTLSPTALLHETYLRLIKPGAGPWTSRQHFFAVASHTMRQVLVDYARAYRAKKRGGPLARIDLDPAMVCTPASSAVLLDLDRALKRLAKLSPRQSRIVELRFFGGLSLRETAAVLGVGVTLVKADWALARAWLLRELQGAS